LGIGLAIQTLQDQLPTFGLADSNTFIGSRNPKVRKPENKTVIQRIKIVKTAIFFVNGKIVSNTKHYKSPAFTRPQ